MYNPIVAGERDLQEAQGKDVLWTPKTRFFDPIDITNALDRGFQAIENSQLKGGYRWELGGRIRTNIEFYPQVGLAGISYLGAAQDEQVRAIPVTLITKTPNDAKAVTFVSQKPSRFWAVTVNAKGELVELNRLMDGYADYSAQVTLLAPKAVRVKMPTLKIPKTIETYKDISGLNLETAQNIVEYFSLDDIACVLRAASQKNPNNFRPTALVYEFLRKFPEAELLALNTLVTRTMDILSQKTFIEDDEIYKTLYQRVVLKMSWDEIAKETGYSREHATRKFHQPGLQLFRLTLIEELQEGRGAFLTELEEQAHQKMERREQTAEITQQALPRITLQEPELKGSLPQLESFIELSLKRMGKDAPGRDFLRSIKGIVTAYLNREPEEQPE